MANIQLTIARTSPVSSFSRNKDFSDGDLDRLLAAATAQLKDQGIANPTQSQLADYLFARLTADFKTLSRNSETSAAAAAVTNIGL
jgi:hypothetical protein